MVTYKVSRIINAPIKYVYDWATDFSEGDSQFWGGTPRRVILLKTRTKAVYASYKDGSYNKPKLAVGVVTLRPSKYSWHLDYFSEQDHEAGDYKLVNLGKDKTRLNMVFHNQWKHGNGPSASDFEKGTSSVWDKYSEGLERDFKSGKKAK